MPINSLRVLRTPCIPTRQTRHFHATRPVLLVNEVLDASAGFIHGVHTVSCLPWVASIPLTAIIVRMSVGLPLQIYSKIQARKEQDVAPIMTSWRHNYQAQIRKDVNRSSGDPMMAGQANMQLLKMIKTKKRALDKAWGIHRFWKPVPFLQLPVWLSIMESLRAMSGNSSGLVPWLLSLTRSSSDISLAVEPSLATEGGLWFQDLLAGDSTGILPIFLAGSIITNIRTGWKAPSFKEIASLPRPERVRLVSSRLLKLFLQTLALYVGAASYVYQMPCALMIYWITSTNLATTQSLLLDKFMFKRPGLKQWRKFAIGHPPLKKA
ncbi:putative mitochondrial export translocase Oxa2 [Aspergillus ruber CBS 135680]|uniref:Putative mitochondrial export translocase Oxa2 n=1 Tax=Aspergillus ruber (strain CBS 135680) TaxID=1388766 RepID=A0A017SR51_ASPRC|nr:putative mitochondrial export translocase Oxa2 [Aspergillus ruber CBS 135680]EYE99447.1 putative mitochondrial export translocase Oxa2 [Aspergillus ruber CBS 135680]